MEGMKSKGHNQGSHLKPELSSILSSQWSMLICHLTVEYVMNSWEVKWNGWWGTGFLKTKENRRLRMMVSRAVACLVKIIRVPQIIMEHIIYYCIQFYINSTVSYVSYSECNITSVWLLHFLPSQYQNLQNIYCTR
jgi:hypothetical protein